ncbi:hypothetical protein pb186bvf_017454 [Paramecium bursaria]
MQSEGLDSTTQSSRQILHDLNEQQFDENVIDKLVNLHRDLFPNQYLFPIKEFQVGQGQSLFSCKYHPSAQYIACGTQIGVINIIFSSKDFSSSQLIDTKSAASPVTCLRWRPCNDPNFKNTLLATYTDGKVIYWHATSNQALYRIQEKDNQVNCCDFTADGNKFLTAGSDCKIRMYDMSKLSNPCQVMEAGDSAGHTNRIFGLRVNQFEPHTVYSGGWDKTLIRWDLRSKLSTGSIYGPQIYGDAIDIKENMVLTGSFREDKQLEIWDTKQMTKLANIEWKEYGKLQIPDLKPQISKLYTACFDQSKSYIYAASVGKLYSEIRVFDTKQNFSCVDTFCQPLSGVMTIDHNVAKNQLCYGLQNGLFGCMNIVN